MSDVELTDREILEAQQLRARLADLLVPHLIRVRELESQVETLKMEATRQHHQYVVLDARCSSAEARAKIAETSLANSQREAAEAQALVGKLKYALLNHAEVATFPLCSRAVLAERIDAEFHCGSAALQSAIEEAVAPYREDAERLDYLDTNSFAYNYGWQVYSLENGLIDKIETTGGYEVKMGIRAAIDAARNTK